MKIVIIGAGPTGLTRARRWPAEAMASSRSTLTRGRSPTARGAATV